MLHNGNLVDRAKIDDKKIIIWNHTTQIEKKILSGHNRKIICLTLLPSTGFASASEDGEIKIWTSNGDLKKTFQAHKKDIKSLISLQNEYLASGSCDNTIKVWDRDGNLKQTLTGHTDCVRALAQLNNGLLASGSEDKTMRIWNKEGKQVKIYSFNNTIENLAVLPDGDLIYQVDYNRINILSIDQLLNGNQEPKMKIKSKNYIDNLVVYSNGDIVVGGWGEMEFWKREQY